ncbi:MAG TPA: hypothetical protein VGO93_04760, partial [Candidatus Xenobia bacterium]
TPGVVTRPDPQLLQTWWSNLAVRDGIRERDEVRIERNGETVAKALVVCVTADHSSLMLTGSHPNLPQAGDAVVLVKQAAAVQATPAMTKSTVAYKVVGGHSMMSFASTGIGGGTGFAGGGGFGGGASFGGGGGFGAEFGVSSGTSFGGSAGFSSNVTTTPSGFSSDFNCGGDLNFGGGLGF